MRQTNLPLASVCELKPEEAQALGAHGGRKLSRVFRLTDDAALAVPTTGKAAHSGRSPQIRRKHLASIYGQQRRHHEHFCCCTAMFRQ